ncbi:MAG TPA: pyridoxamine 5'-phosphate oxidase family protein [Methanomassiliicoccales archaeon]|nr:pyridoxamine 5'-phosphate oxidase family protein [Methanomassiliicoccales archaeon]
MVTIPAEVVEAVNNPKAAKVLATVKSDGSPHIITVGSIIAPNPTTVAFGAILMKETSKNLETMKKKGLEAVVLVTVEMKSYQIRGKVKEKVSSGPLFDKMNENLKKIGLQAQFVWTLEPTEVWNQSASYDAGKKMV